MKRVHRMCAFGILTGLLLGVGGCAARKGPEPVKLSSRRPPPMNLMVVDRAVRRQDLVQATERADEVERIRLVDVFDASRPDRTLREHRLFDIAPGSIYELLGLQNADILVAMNDYVIYNPRLFKQAVGLLPREKTAEIEIRRAQRPILFKIRVTD